MQNALDNAEDCNNKSASTPITKAASSDNDGKSLTMTLPLLSGQLARGDGESIDQQQRPQDGNHDGN
jgi:hypothetical protein